MQAEEVGKHGHREGEHGYKLAINSCVVDLQYNYLSNHAESVRIVFDESHFVN